MDCSLTSEQTLLVEAARGFARHELLALDRASDSDESPITPILPRLAEMGFLNLRIPEEFNGVGCGMRTYTAIIHEIAYASPSTAVTLGVHNMVGAAIVKWASEPLRPEWARSWGDPGSFSAFALSEAGAGSDAAATATVAEPVEGGHRITGEKMWITNGLSCRWFLVLARVGTGKEGLTAFLVDGAQEGIERTKVQGKMGIRGSETAIIHFDGAFVPESHQVGRVGDGLRVFLGALTSGRAGIAAQATGIAEACLDEMVAYARQRVQFGKSLAQFQAVQTMIADSATELSAARELTCRAAWLMDMNDENASASSMAKLYASEAANRIAYRALQIHGGAGYVQECRVEQLARDVRVTTIYEGTSEIQRLIIAKALMRGAELS